METIESLKTENEALKKEITQLRSAGHITEINLEDQAEYQHSQLRFRTIFEFSTLSNKIISSDLKILQVNPALVRLLGYHAKEDIIGTRILDYSPPDHHQHWQALQKELWEKATPSFSLETCLIKKDKTIIWCRVTSILFPDQGQMFGYTIIEDVTEEHHLRIQKEEFISIASHELKTPITSLKAVLQLLNRMIKDETAITGKIAQLARDADRYTSKLTHLVEDLLNSTKIEQGKLILHKTQFLLSEVIEDCCNHVRLDARHYLTHAGDLNIGIYADKNKIEQILVNFVNNAVKYAPLSQEIAIKVERLEKAIKISVSDAGKGIAPENIPHLFDRYYQVTIDGQHAAGLGLGLYISAEIIRQHGGEIGIDSELGKGSTFWFTLPE